MESFLGRFKNPLVLVLVVLIQTIALAVQVQRTAPPGMSAANDSPKISALRYWSTILITPLERVLHGSNMHVRDIWQGYVNLHHTKQHNHDLEQEIARLRQEQAAFAEDAEQGRRLRALLNFQQQYIATTVPAQIIGTSGSDRSRVVWLDKGSKDGLKTDQAVMTPDGIVGKIRDVSEHSSQLLLINDATAGAGVILESTRIRGIIRGAVGGRVEINNLTADSRIKPGEHVVTSGGDGVFPRGLPVGVIESIAPDPDHQPYTAIRIKPAADLARLEEVLVITGTQATMPGAAQEDAAAALVNAATAKRAAELASERLPSIHDDEKPVDPKAQTPAGTPAAPAPLIPTVPRPVATVHADRYSPGATPSAEELKPGVKSDQIRTPQPATSAPATPPEKPEL